MSTAEAVEEPQVVPFGTRPEYWAGHRASTEQIRAWVEQFHRDGYLLIKNVLPPEWCAELRADLDKLLGGHTKTDQYCEIRMRMFETSAANLRLFDLEPIVTFAEQLVAPDCHVIHNNSFITLPGQGISTWHQDDAPHFLVTEGEAPKNVRLPVLLFTSNYYLTDVSEPANGGTECIPGSHLFGKHCPPEVKGTPYERLIDHNCAPAGSVVLFNNQCWHRGGPNTSQRTRYMTQVSYARRIIGHKYYPFMNYQMPEHCYKDADSRLKRLLGFLPRGAYG
ncbi:MAG TPA: phytanoyl-CoA dioxygenase family protein [Planctomycetota bacterium]|nr:phytanoyl-CoA dioxygenase family protein [Planctomycetota bacterium]